ncbi:aminodeoxychorismate synthase component I [Actinoplanes sp. CA-030573]|uniref:aminodeoxychorismate synthase component I n=1 Tax=Actinoplanes sp. CA-030573 TaxID=3239898 RepID=UPI003D8E61E7
MTAHRRARFDDLVTGRALAFPPPRRVIAAGRPADVPAALAEVERLTAAGEWAYGYVSYEAAPAFDPALVVAAPAAGDPPLVWFGVGGPPAPVPPIAPDRASPGERRPGAGALEEARQPGAGALEWAPAWTDQQHARAVERVREHIAAGDTYQCNLTDRLRAAATGDPFDLYRQIAGAQGGAFNAYLDLGRFVVASASPELFFDWTGDRIRTRPMKGTTTRGADPADDAERAQRLRASPKEQAENLMIVDLLRNDLSRVATVGSVEVTELFALEAYPTVWQMVSEIAASVRPGTGLADVFRALFPCGSVTGAPKARSMGIIRDLESGPRGVYCGAVGMVAPPAAEFRARFNVAIRTAMVDRRSGTATYGAGGGITWGSDAAAERAELLAKTAVLNPRGQEAYV